MCYAFIVTKKEKLLNNKIMQNIDILAEAYNRRNKMLYKEGLISLELDLAEYFMKMKKEYPQQINIIKLYERLWDFDI